MENKISIIIPVYNAEYCLSRCIDSILSKKIDHVEIICVDDSSTDKSVQIIKEYSKLHNNIKLFTQKHSNAGVARNYGLEKASGKYIFFMDADDYMVLDDFYSVFIDLFDKYDADLIKTKHYAVDYFTGKYIENKEYNMSFISKDKFYIPLNIIDNYYELTKTPITPWCGIYKKSFIIENNIKFDTMPYHNDLFFYENVLLKSKRIFLADLFLTAHQINNPNSLTQAGSVRRECLLNNTQILCSCLIKEKCEINDLLIRWRLSRVPWMAIKEEIGVDAIHQYMDSFEIGTLCKNYWYEHNIVGLLDIYGINCWDIANIKVDKINKINDLKIIAANSKNNLYIYSEQEIKNKIDNCTVFNDNNMNDIENIFDIDVYINAHKYYLPETYFKLLKMGFGHLKILTFFLE